MPPNKRNPAQLAWITALLTPMQWLNNINYLYQTGATIPQYSNTISYSAGTLVLGWFDYNRSVYMSLTDANLGNPLSDPTNWILVLDDFIGVNERLLYNSNKLTLEWALNHYFGTTFRQPPLVPDIFIDDNVTGFSTFYVSNNPDVASYIFPTYSSGYVSNVATPTSATYNYTINFPNSVYITLPGYAGPGTVDHYISNFVDPINVAGTIYKIVTY